MKEIVTLDTGQTVCGNAYGSKYIVTEDGRVFTYWHNHRKWKEQQRRKHSNGYLRAAIDGKDEYIHRIVAKLYVPNPNGYFEVNHKDGDKTNNNASNLEWCTRSQNNKHAFQTGLRSYGELSKMAKMPKLKRRKFSEEDIKAIRRLHNEGKSDKELADFYGCARGVIYQIWTRKSYKEVTA